MKIFFYEARGKNTPEKEAGLSKLENRKRKFRNQPESGNLNGRERPKRKRRNNEKERLRSNLRLMS